MLRGFYLCRPGWGGETFGHVKPDRARQCGQALVEWLIVSMLAALAAVWAAGELAREAEVAASRGHAQWLLAVGRAIDQAMAAHDARATDDPAWFDAISGEEVVPVQPWLDRLQAAGWLPTALSRTPALPYNVGLVKVDGQGHCDTSPCVRALLLLAVPKAGHPVPDPTTVLLALQGRGLAVSDLAPNRLRGATFDLPNPPTGQQRLPVGTVALLAWRDDHESPYVRLHESRQVTLASGVVLGKRAQTDGACHPSGLVTLSPQGELQVCRDGHWDEVLKSHEHFRACLPQTREQAFRAAWFKYTGFWALMGGGVNCDCDAGFAPVQVVGDDGRVGTVTLRDGYLCQRL